MKLGIEEISRIVKEYYKRYYEVEVNVNIKDINTVNGEYNYYDEMGLVAYVKGKSFTKKLCSSELKDIMFKVLNDDGYEVISFKFNKKIVTEYIKCKGGTREVTSVRFDSAVCEYDDYILELGF